MNKHTMQKQIKPFLQAFIESKGWTGTENFTFMMHDRPSMYSTTVHSIVQQYNSKQVQCKD